MAIQNESLPEHVRESLDRGETIEAIRRLCEATGLGLKESMDVIDGYLKRRPTTASPNSSPGQFPAPVLEALQRGDKIKAIKLLRQARGIGLKEAKDAVDGVMRQTNPATGTRPAVDRPRSASTIWWLAVLALAGYAVYYLAA